MDVLTSARKLNGYSIQKTAIIKALIIKISDLDWNYPD